MPQEVGRYRLGPFILASEIPIPELDSRQEPTATPDVFIRLGKTPDRLENVVANETRWWASRDEYLLRVPGVASFYVAHGRDVIVEPAPDSLPGDIRAYLLSPIFSTLCYQSGMYSLHASSVRVGDGVVAFLGDSGAGKSTLAATLDRRGLSVISDDICLLDPRAAERDGTLVVPVAPAIKLWRNALERLGESPEAHPLVWSKEEKYRLKISEASDRLPLRQVLFLEWAAPDAPITFTPVEGVHAIKRLMDFTHYDYLMKPTGRRTENFVLAGRVLSQLKAFALSRPRSFDRIDEVTEAILAHLASTTPEDKVSS